MFIAEETNHLSRKAFYTTQHRDPERSILIGRRQKWRLTAASVESAALEQAHQQAITRAWRVMAELDGRFCLCALNVTVPCI